MVQTIIGRFQEFMRQPFNPQGDVVSWALFIMLLITVAILWRQTLKSITEG